MAEKDEAYFPLTPSQIESYLRDGILVVDDLLAPDEIDEANVGLSQTLKEEYGVDVNDLEGTGCGLRKASSTNGAGGVLDIFYPEWKMKIATNETLFRMTCQLWKEAYCHSGESLEDCMALKSTMTEACNDGDISGNNSNSNSIDVDNSFKWHPYGLFDFNKGFMYIDRIGYRIPTKIAESIGRRLLETEAENDEVRESSSPKPKTTITTMRSYQSNKKKKKSRQKKVAIQRSLTPHLDCCPETFFATALHHRNNHPATSSATAPTATNTAHENNDTKPSSTTSESLPLSANTKKWRPIQCFVSLTNNLQPNTGGFEAVPGFHREFRSWVESGRRQRSSASSTSATANKMAEEQDLQVEVEAHPKQCVGEYTHLSPKHDWWIMERVKHVPVKAGSVVFWDNRIPHANSYRNDAPLLPDNRQNNHLDRDDDKMKTNNGLSTQISSSGARAVVYCSFLPDVEANRQFIWGQLQDWKMCRPPRVGDRWIDLDDADDGDERKHSDGSSMEANESARVERLGELGRRLIGLEEWE